MQTIVKVRKPFLLRALLILQSHKVTWVISVQRVGFVVKVPASFSAVYAFHRNKWITKILIFLIEAEFVNFELERNVLFNFENYSVLSLEGMG